MALQEELESQGLWLFKKRGVLPVIILVIGTYLYVQTRMNPEAWSLRGTEYEKYYVYACLLVSFLGLAIRVYTVGHTPSGTSGRNTKGQVADSLNSTGIYSTIRHPLYVGNFFMWLGIAMLTANFWFLIASTFLYWLYYERIMFAEEQFLRKKFGETYLAWANRTPAILPKFSQFVKPKYDFSWKKVLTNEKTGVFNVFVIFCFFDILGKYINHSTDYDMFLIGATVASLLLLIILKVIKSSSTFLNEEGR
jgi:protein-S-isoprenylcysteine O-methyltransferase Ste14